MPIKQSAFSLIEVLVFVTLLSIFFISAASVTTVVLRSLKSNEQRIIASRYNEELIEWLRSEKDADWNTFSGYSSAGGSTYCYDDLSWTNPTPCSYSIDNTYKREAVITSVASTEGRPYQINIRITVEWLQGQRTEYVQTNTLFSIWER